MRQLSQLSHFLFSCIFLAYEISLYLRFGRRSFNSGSLPSLYALKQPRHIVPQSAHGLHTLGILLGLTGGGAVDAVPVLAGGDGHAGDGEELVQLVKGRGAASASCNGDGSADLHRFVKAGAVKQAVKKRDKRTVGRSIIYRTAYYKPITLLKFRSYLVYNIINSAFTVFISISAGNTASDILCTDLHSFGFNVVI